MQFEFIKSYATVAKYPVVQLACLLSKARRAVTKRLELWKQKQEAHALRPWQCYVVCGIACSLIVAKKNRTSSEEKAALRTSEQRIGNDHESSPLIRKWTR